MRATTRADVSAPTAGLGLDGLGAAGPSKNETKNGVWERAQRRLFASPGDRLKGQPQERQHSAADFGGTRDRLPPARGAIHLLPCATGWKPEGQRPCIPP